MPSDFRSTYRAVYTVKFKETIAVLHVFQKKSKQGIAMSKKDVELIKIDLNWQSKSTKNGCLKGGNHEKRKNL